jgi:hypothetical protein
MALAVGALAPASALADPFTVQNTNDSGPGSLRQAILDSNVTAGPDTIDFAASVSTAGLIVLTTGQLQIKGELTINGP